MKKTSFSTIVIAAGKGTRMKTSLPKVLHPAAGRPMLHWVLNAAKAAGSFETRVVLGFGADLTRPLVEQMGAHVFIQKDQRGTADAVKAGEPQTLDGMVVILNGDHPLISAEDISSLVAEHLAGGQDLSVVTAKVKNPGSFGRIIRQGGKLKAIVEAKDAGHDALKINEINTGIYIGHAKLIALWLQQVQPNNAQKEYYLTDIITIALSEGKKVEGILGKPHVAFGVNTQSELSVATRNLFKRKLNSLMENGVMVTDTRTTYVEDNVQVGAGTVLLPGCYLKAGTRIGANCIVGPYAMISDSIIGDGVEIRMGSVVDQSTIKKGTTVGPYAHLRPGNVIEEECKVGNFVEMKKVAFGKGSKASHLTYLGDAEIGENVNIGCGTITCNYGVDKKKHKTKIGNNVFVGSDTQFVAPVTVGDDAYVGSGSTITKDIPAKALGVARTKQVNVENYKPKKSEG